MASPKRPTLAQSGIDKMFQPSEVPPASKPDPSVTRADAKPAESWEATHRRRTFHCDNRVWERLVSLCQETGISRSAAISEALEVFLTQRGR